MVKAIVVRAYGGPDVMKLEDVDAKAPGPGEALVRHRAVGVNFIDCYFRTGLYPAPSGLPFTPGNEACGVVEAVGAGVTTVAPGDRVVYVVSPGSYTEARVVAADKLLKVPDGIPDDIAATMMLKGMTVQYLLNQTYKVGPETTLLFHAAAGGVGLIASQWAKHLGATVIGTAGGKAKCDLARQAGCDHVIDYRAEDFVARVKELTGGKLCDVVYDSVGKDTFPGSLDCLKPRGLWVSFGNASGPVPPFPMTLLSQKGSLFATRPTLNNYTANRADLEKTAADLFRVVASGAVKIEVHHRYALADAEACHRDLEGRKTTGASVLLP
jgi:NADPH2:quinone reductase